MRHDRQGGERQRIPCHERQLAKEAGVALDQLINVAVAEKLSAVSTARFFTERGARGDVGRAMEILSRAGVGNPPRRGDELPDHR